MLEPQSVFLQYLGEKALIEQNFDILQTGETISSVASSSFNCRANLLNNSTKNSLQSSDVVHISDRCLGLCLVLSGNPIEHPLDVFRRKFSNYHQLGLVSSYPDSRA